MQEQHIEFLPPRRKEKRINVLKTHTRCISVVNINVQAGYPIYHLQTRCKYIPVRSAAASLLPTVCKQYTG